MSVFLEDPTLVLVGGLVIVATLGVALYQTRRVVFAGIIVGVLLLIAGLVALEAFVVTDRERIEHVLDSAARAIEHGDVKGVNAHVANRSPTLKQQVANLLPQFIIEKIGIGGDLQITVNREAEPPRAKAAFTCRVEGRHHRLTSPYGNYVQKFDVDFIEEEGAWRIFDYETRSPLPGAR